MDAIGCDMEPLLLDMPTEIATDRLRLRVPRAGDGAVVAPTVLASLPQLKPWLPWATDAYDGTSAELWARRAAGQFLLRQQFQFLIFTAAGEHVGNVGLFNLRWDVPEGEIGYWLGTPFVGRGYMAEAVAAVVAMAFDALSAERVVIRCEAVNGRSRRVAERCGFALDGTLRRWGRDTAGRLGDECVYSKLR